MKSAISRPRLVPIAIAVLLLSLAATLRFRPGARTSAAARPPAVGAAASTTPTTRTASAASRPVAHPVSWEDRFADGTPDFLRLDTESDREAFRRWFALVAEFQALRPADQIPTEIRDCAALLRYSYRNALRVHDQAWVTETKILPPGAPPPVAKYHYPFTAVGAGLFRVRPGPALPQDASDGAFAEFADARTLKSFNTYFVSRDIRDARPGDLLFYRQLVEDEPYHSMIFVGRSEWLPQEAAVRAAWDDAIVVYDTGPVGHAPGQMRRVRLAELLAHPSPRWRPVPGNSNFLGVFRWTILRDAE
jgi:uncharacterized protein YfaT (DUF1175 family)